MLFKKKDALDTYFDLYNKLGALEEKRVAIIRACTLHSPPMKMCTTCFEKSWPHILNMAQTAHCVLTDLHLYVSMVNLAYELLTQFFDKAQTEYHKNQNPHLMQFIQSLEHTKKEYMNLVTELDNNSYLNTKTLEWNKDAHE